MSNASAPSGRPSVQRSTSQGSVRNDSTDVEFCATTKGPCVGAKVDGERIEAKVCATPAGPCAKAETSAEKAPAVFGGAIVGGLGALALGATGGVALVFGGLGALVGHALTEPRPKGNPDR
jgi:hypothetical protein